MRERKREGIEIRWRNKYERKNGREEERELR